MIAVDSRKMRAMRVRRGRWTRGEGEKGQKGGDDDVVWRWLMVVVTMMGADGGGDGDDDGRRAVAETATRMLSSPSRRAFYRSS